MKRATFDRKNTGGRREKKVITPENFLGHVSFIRQLIYICTPWFCRFGPPALLSEAKPMTLPYLYQSLSLTLQTSFENIRPETPKWHYCKILVSQFYKVLLRKSNILVFKWTGTTSEVIDFLKDNLNTMTKCRTKLKSQTTDSV